MLFMFATVSHQDTTLQLQPFDVVKFEILLPYSEEHMSNINNVYEKIKRISVRTSRYNMCLGEMNCQQCAASGESSTLHSYWFIVVTKAGYWTLIGCRRGCWAAIG